MRAPGLLFVEHADERNQVAVHREMQRLLVAAPAKTPAGRKVTTPLLALMTARATQVVPHPHDARMYCPATSGLRLAAA